MTCPRCGGIAVGNYATTTADGLHIAEEFERCHACGWQSNFATQRAEREEVTEWIYDEGDDDA